MLRFQRSGRTRAGRYGRCSRRFEVRVAAASAFVCISFVLSPSSRAQPAPTPRADPDAKTAPAPTEVVPAPTRPPSAQGRTGQSPVEKRPADAGTPEGGSAPPPKTAPEAEPAAPRGAAAQKPAEEPDEAAPPASAEADVVDALPADAAARGNEPATSSAEAPASSAEPESSEAPSEPVPAAQAAVPGSLDAAQPDGAQGVRGRVLDSATGEGVPDAIVLAEGRNGEGDAVTNATGGYVIVLPNGQYTVTSFADLYHGARMPRVVVRSARWKDLTLTLDAMDPDAVAEEVEIVYRADTTSVAAQDQLRASASGIGEGMGAEQMSRSGASDAGSAAQNVVGVTLEGTNLNVRGLGGRYTLVLLNGISLPSTDPDEPAVDLDLFPAQVIDNLNVSKAFMPDQPGAFAGGVLDIRTVRFPREFTFDLGISAGFNTMSTFRDRLSYRGGDTDWLGFDDGTRGFPSGLDGRLTVGRGYYPSLEALSQEARRFPNRWQFERSSAVPPFGVDVTLGDRLYLGGGSRFGYLVSAGYDFSQLREVGIARPRPTITADTGALAAFNDYALERGVQEVKLHALGTASLELGQDDVFSFLTLVNRSATDETQRQTGTSGELRGDIERWMLQYLARSLWFNQLRGDHRNIFGSRVRLRWTGYGSYGAREEPDRRTVTYGPQGGLYRWLDKAQSGERFYSNLEQIDVGASADLRIPLWTEAWGSMGGQVQATTRDFGNRRLRFRQIADRPGQNQADYNLPVEELFSAQSIGTLVQLDEPTRSDDSYAANQEYYAGFALVETPLGSDLSLNAGARLEAFHQRISNESPFQNERGMGGALTDRTDIDVLPAASLRFSAMEKMNLRAAYGMTVARPQLRELASYQYYDFIRDRNVAGNPNLNRTLIQNADLRWEWFFGEGEIVALSAFYKYFDQPIERQIKNPNNYDSVYINSESAHNLGGELEFRFGFGRLLPELAGLSFLGNVALIWSRVTLPDEESGATESERALLGQAPYIVNASLAYDLPALGLSTSVLYSVTGPRISDVGTRANTLLLPNIVRAPFHSVDLIVRWTLVERLSLGVKVRNILLQTQDFYQNDFLTQRTEPGLTGSISIGYSE